MDGVGGIFGVSVTWWVWKAKVQACRFALGKKTQAKKNSSKIKTQAKNSPKTQGSHRKTQITGNFSSNIAFNIFMREEKVTFRGFFTQKLGFFAQNSIILQKTLRFFFEKLKDFCKNSRNFSKNSVYRKIYSPKLP